MRNKLRTVGNVLAAIGISLAVAAWVGALSVFFRGHQDPKEPEPEFVKLRVLPPGNTNIAVSVSYTRTALTSNGPMTFVFLCSTNDGTNWERIVVSSEEVDEFLNKLEPAR